jgi:ribosomal protein L37AE/L43A
MNYSSIQRINERSQLAFLGLLVFLIVVAWAFMFVHGWVTIFLFWMGLIAAGVYAFAHSRIARAAAREARHSIEAHACPRCGAEVRRNGAEEWQCLECGASFLESGREMEAPHAP